MDRRRIFRVLVLLAAGILAAWLLWPVSTPDPGRRATGGEGSEASASSVSVSPGQPRWVMPGLAGTGPEAAAPAAVIEVTVLAEAAISLEVCVEQPGVSIRTERRRCHFLAEAGTTVFEELPAGDWHVIAVAEGYVPAHQKRTLAGGVRESVELTLLPGGEVLEGQVFAGTGEPVAGARVDVMNETHQILRTDAEGRFSFAHEDAEAWVRVEAEGFAIWIGELVAGVPARIELRPGGALLVETVRPDGEAVPGLQVRAEMDDAMGVPASSGGETDEAGRTVLEGLLPGRYLVFASGPGARGSTPESVEVRAGRPATEVKLVVGQGWAVRTTVLDEAGAPAKRVVLTLEPTGASAYTTRARMWAKPRGWIAKTGEVRIEGVLPGTYALDWTVSGYQVPDTPAEVVVIDSEVDLGVITLAGWSGRIEGRVVDPDGAPVPDVGIFAYHLGSEATATPTTSDSEGRFFLEVGEDGEWTVWTGLRVEDDHQGVTVTGGRADPVLLTVTPASELGTIVGQVEGAGGSTGEGCRVRLRHLEAGGSDEGGRPRYGGEVTGGGFRASAPAGRVGVSLEGPRCRLTGGESIVEVPADGEAYVVLELATAEGRITGLVLDSAGKPVPQVVVKLFEHPPRHALKYRRNFGGLEAVTDSKGRFAFEHLDPEPFSVALWAPNGEVLERAPVEPNAEVVLRLGEGQTLAGQVLDPQGEPLSPARVVAESPVAERKTTAEGPEARFTFANLTPGTWVLTAEGAGGRGSTTVTVRKDVEAAPVVITAHTGCTVRGTLVRPTEGPGGSGPFVIVNRERFPLEAGGRFEARASGGNFRLGFPGQLPSVAMRCQGEDLELGPVTLPKAPETRGYFGFSPVWPPAGDDPASWRVVLAVVEPEGAATLAGLAAGDVIVSLDGKDVTGARAGWFRLWVTAAPGREAVFGLADGRSVKVTAR